MNKIMSTYLDKTFCASPNCQNDCGRRMTLEEHERLIYLNDKEVCYGYFCGLPDTIDQDFSPFIQINNVKRTTK
jgi:hypothetical protein